MRYGSYSEDSDESDSHGHKGSDRTSTKTRKEHSIPEVSLKQELEDAVQSNSETSFYSYHSDDENENIERMQIQEQKNVNEQSPNSGHKLFLTFSAYK
jgi:molybdopterin-biosynthesis enzyme MoeA-like protein